MCQVHLGGLDGGVSENALKCVDATPVSQVLNREKMAQIVESEADKALRVLCQLSCHRTQLGGRPVDGETLAAKIEQAKEAGATFIVIDTPPHADTTASKAMEAADLVLIPCRPSAFDLAAIRTTATLVQLLAKPAWVANKLLQSGAARLSEAQWYAAKWLGDPVR